MIFSGGKKLREAKCPRFILLSALRAFRQKTLTYTLIDMPIQGALLNDRLYHPSAGVRVIANNGKNTVF